MQTVVEFGPKKEDGHLILAVTLPWFEIVAALQKDPSLGINSPPSYGTFHASTQYSMARSYPGVETTIRLDGPAAGHLLQQAGSPQSTHLSDPDVASTAAIDCSFLICRDGPAGVSNTHQAGE
jgi:hypothetical protein